MSSKFVVYGDEVKKSEQFDLGKLAQQRSLWRHHINCAIWIFLIGIILRNLNVFQKMQMTNPLCVHFFPLMGICSLEIMASCDVMSCLKLDNMIKRIKKKGKVSRLLLDWIYQNGLAMQKYEAKIYSLKIKAPCSLWMPFLFFGVEQILFLLRCHRVTNENAETTSTRRSSKLQKYKFWITKNIA